MSSGSRPRPTELLEIVLGEVQALRIENAADHVRLGLRVAKLEVEAARREGASETRSKVVGLLAGGFGALVTWVLTRISWGN